MLGATPVKSPYQGASTGPNGPAAPVFRGLDCAPGSDVFVAGTHRSDIWEIDETPEVLIYGHSADLYGVAWDPTNPTAGTSTHAHHKSFSLELDTVFIQSSLSRPMRDRRIHAASAYHAVNSPLPYLKRMNE